MERLIDDRTLVAAAKAGNIHAFGILVERHQRRALSVALGIVRNKEDARDLCQEAFLRAYRNLDTFAEDAQFFTWLYRVVKNLCLDHLRSQAVRRTSDLDEKRGVFADVSVERDPHRKFEARETGARLNAAIARLSPAHRRTLLLREVDGLSYQQIARQMGCSIGTVMSRLFHARRNM